MYDATDILELCQLKAIGLGCCNPLLFCLWNPLFAHDIASRICILCKTGAGFNLMKLEGYPDGLSAPIVGVGRIGKTTIAKNIFNEEAI
ncbi:hypothetical protein E2562_026301 [Oryza meyeriana var. granulata]|uniref:Uncharacterized protein n=1 Tax=Oryza meyeriana var. granulata TaxID=110450 RepID=A0A6G1C801_9ORYZ|nr:hypothetical protein E2562_026301 [Oryza meyeriana var. granulata]